MRSARRVAAPGLGVAAAATGRPSFTKTPARSPSLEVRSRRPAGSLPSASLFTYRSAALVEAAPVNGSYSPAPLSSARATGVNA